MQTQNAANDINFAEKFVWLLSIAEFAGNFNLHNLPDGVYLIRLSGLRGTCKVVKGSE